jgi:hypothetical protein
MYVTTERNDLYVEMQLEIMQSQLLPVRDNAITVILTGTAGTGTTGCRKISDKILLMKRSILNLR